MVPLDSLLAGSPIQQRQTPRSWRSGAVVLCLLATAGCLSHRAETDATWTARHAEELRQAGQRLGVPVRPAAMVQFADAGMVLFTAPAANLETIPPARYPAGVDLGVAYLETLAPVVTEDSSEVKIPKGFYKLRAFSAKRGDSGPGSHLQLIDSSGGIVADLPAETVTDPGQGDGLERRKKLRGFHSVLVFVGYWDGAPMYAWLIQKS
ncbi:MAG TPA: hypothetical protein VMM92_11715 [Thermoanaerobaculia bacterium]|nr:hypothetical protein [Thermoanaerobaculia bacterium]